MGLRNSRRLLLLGVVAVALVLVAVAVAAVLQRDDGERLGPGSQLSGEIRGALSRLGPDELATIEIVNQPGWVHGNDAAWKNYQVVWAYPTSPSTPYRSPDSQRQISRYMLLDPRRTDSEGRPGQDEWWIIIERNWPSSYPASNHGDWGRQVNFHGVAGDDGGIGWGCTNNGVTWCTGVSSLALDWRPSQPAPELCVLCAIKSQGGASYPLPVPQRGVWQTYVIHYIAGRTDGTTVRPGLVQIWVNGNDTPVVNRTNINTMQRARDPGGVWRLQRWMVLWEGDYTRNLPVPAKHRLVLTRMGKTLDEALADRPTLKGTTLGGYDRLEGAAPEPSLVVLPSGRKVTDARIPASLTASSP
jgi:hypothetical protein